MYGGMDASISGVDNETGPTIGGKGGAIVPTPLPNIAQWDIFSNTITAGRMRAYGSSYARSNPNIAGTRMLKTARLADSIPLNYNQLNQLRRIGGPATDPDVLGERYIGLQLNHLAQRP
jgi:hypothetical protein